MNWDAIGAVGEVLGALAVVLTLIYLARETRKNAQAIDATSTRDTLYQISEWHREVARDPELKRILMKAIAENSGSFSAEEWVEFRLLAISLFQLYQSHFVHQSLEVGNKEISLLHIGYAQAVISTWPAWRRFWDEEVSSGTFLPEFVDAVNGSHGADYSQMATSREINN